MDAPFDLTSERLRLSVAEAIAWCACQQLTTHVEETEEIKKRRMLVEQAHLLLTQAYLEEGRFWNRVFRRDYRKTREWQLAEKLLLETDAASLKPPLADQLRTPALKPNSLVAVPAGSRGGHNLTTTRCLGRGV